MIHHLENHINVMKQKPEHIRRRYALGVSLGFTLIIFLFWIITHTLAINPSPVSTVNAPSPVSSLTASVGDAFGYVKDMIFGSSKVDYNAPVFEVTGGKN